MNKNQLIKFFMGILLILSFLSTPANAIAVNIPIPKFQNNASNFSLEALSDRNGSTVINLTISLHNAPNTPATQAPYERILEYFADAIYEQSNGANKLGKVTIYPNYCFSNKADIIWRPTCHPNAHVSGYAFPGWRIEMCDVFSWLTFLQSDYYWKMGGYTLAHELGHYFYSLYDEYAGNYTPFSFPHATDTPVSPSLMNNQFNANCAYTGSGLPACQPGQQGRFGWLNFSMASNNTKNTAQHRVYQASGWETLIRPLSADPKNANTTSLPNRLLHPELASVAPTGGSATIKLPNTAARSELNVVWGKCTSTIEIVLDKSGSMAGKRLSDAKAAAKLLVDLFQTGKTTIGVVAFDKTASVILAPTPMNFPADKTTIKNAIDSIVASGNTAIGDGANKALSELTTYDPTGNTNRIVYLLTDGESNTGVPPLSVIPSYQTAGVPLFTFGFGNAVNHAELQKMAKDTGGAYAYSPTTLADLQKAFQDAAILSSNTVGMTTGTTIASRTARSFIPIIVDSTIANLNVTVTFQVDYDPHLVQLWLIDPGGIPTEPVGCYESEEEVLCILNMENPIPGNWGLEVWSELEDLEIEYRVSGSSEGQMTYHGALLSLPGPVVEYPQPIVLLASLAKEWPITNTHVTAMVTTPDGSVLEFEMKDDGIPPDAVGFDGNYSSVLDYDQDGFYNITVQFRGNAGEALYTHFGLTPTIGPDDEPIPIEEPFPVEEDFERFANHQVQVVGFQPDDHGNIPVDATPIDPTDNHDVHGKIDYAGDVDVFQFTADYSGELVVRVTDLALGMIPRLTVYSADERSVLVEFDSTREADTDMYIFRPINVNESEVYFAEVSHTDPDGLGFYHISIGASMPGEMNHIFLPVIVR